HFDLAAALQAMTERVVFHLLDYLRTQTHSRNLCLAGGVFQNSVLNGKILRSGLFERVHIPPVPGDHGGALGAALHLYHQESKAPRVDMHCPAFLAPHYTDSEIRAPLTQHSDPIRFTRPANIVSEAARRLASDE